jgi:hypothetical protein
MKADLGQRLDELPQLDRTALRELWREVFGNIPHPGLRREILIPILAYRLQERAHGGLKPSAQKRLKALAEDFINGKKPGNGATVQPRAGTRVVREWQGKLHEVAVLENGFEYNGRTYRSLSKIAREITGTRWSGPAFFGMRKRESRRAA